MKYGEEDSAPVRLLDQADEIALVVDPDVEVAVGGEDARRKISTPRIYLTGGRPS